MPAHRKPTKVLEFRGSFRKDPKRGRARSHEPKPNGPIGEPPSSLKLAERACWKEIVDNCPKGVLTKADRIIVELTARLLAMSRKKLPTGFLAQQLRACCASLGMTPADRTRVGVPDAPASKSKWDIDGDPS